MTFEFDAETRFVQRPVLNTTVDNELVLFDEQAGAYYGTSDVGLFIWKQLDEPRTLDELCNVLAKEYEVSREACKADTQQFLCQLVEAKVVVVS